MKIVLAISEGKALLTASTLVGRAGQILRALEDKANPLLEGHVRAQKAKVDALHYVAQEIYDAVREGNSGP